MQNGERLDGWKAIANFLGRERTTAIRWANERGLPVHRVPGGRTGTVYAIRSELDAWLASDRGKPEKLRKSDISGAASSQKPIFRTRTAFGALVAASALVALLLIIFGRASASTDAPVSIAAVASPDANREAREFVRGLNADLARFANASPDLAVFERQPGSVPKTQYVVLTEIDRTNDKMIANARLVAMPNGQLLWSRRFEQSDPVLSVLRERVAASVIGVLRCSFGGLESERAKVRPADLTQLMSICQSFVGENDLGAAQATARQLTLNRPDLALGWALLAKVQSALVEAGDGSLDSEVRASAKRAAAIAPENVATQLALAAARGQGSTDPTALRIIEHALRTHPDQPWLLTNKSVMLFNLGYVNASVDPALASVRNDPSSLGARDLAARRLAAADRMKEGRKLQDDNEQLWPGHPIVVENRLRIFSNSAAARGTDLVAIGKYELEFRESPSVAYQLARLYERTGNRRAAVQWLTRAPVKHAQQQWSLLFWPDAAGLRTEPAFFRKMADLGLVRAWVTRHQWPDFCVEPDLKYDCATEAAKLGIS